MNGTILVLLPLLLVLGILHVAMGKEAKRVLGTPLHPSKLGWAITFVCLALGILVQHWVEGVLRAHGYKES